MRTLEEIRSETMRSDDRILVLEPIEGQKTKDVTGMVDQRLFKGGNRLHAVMDPETCFWSLRYETGIMAEPLRQKFTNFDKMVQTANNYFRTRGLQITRIED